MACDDALNAAHQFRSLAVDCPRVDPFHPLALVSPLRTDVCRRMKTLHEYLTRQIGGRLLFRDEPLAFLCRCIAVLDRYILTSLHEHKHALIHTTRDRATLSAVIVNMVINFEEGFDDDDHRRLIRGRIVAHGVAAVAQGRLMELEFHVWRMIDFRLGCATLHDELMKQAPDPATKQRLCDYWLAHFAELEESSWRFVAHNALQCAQPSARAARAAKRARE